MQTKRSLLRRLLWSLLLVSVISLQSYAQSPDQPYDFVLQEAFPNCDLSTWNSWPGHWNLNSGGSFTPPDASIAVSSDNTQIHFTFTASGGAGYRGDWLLIYVSAANAKFKVITTGVRQVLFKPNDAKAPAVQQSDVHTYTASFDTVAAARAAIPAINAQTLAELQTIGSPVVVGNGTILSVVGTPSVSSVVQADSWQVIGHGGTPQTVAGFPKGFTNNDNGVQGQKFSGDIPFDVASNQGRQITMERWTLQVTSGNDLRFELQSLESIDTPSAAPAAQVQPTESTVTVTGSDGKPRLVTIMSNIEGAWKAALGRDGCQFQVIAISTLSPLSVVELQAKQPGSDKLWITLKSFSVPQNTKTFTGIATVQLGDVCADKPLIPADLSLGGTWPKGLSWLFRTHTRNELPDSDTYSDTVEVRVIIPTRDVTVDTQTLPPAKGQDGDGWFTASAVRPVALHVWCFGLPIPRAK
jgi:hypothetical protein